MMNFTEGEGRYEPMRAIDSAGTSKADKLGRPELAGKEKREREREREKKREEKGNFFFFYYYLSR